MEQPTLADRIRFVLFERGYQEARTVAQLASATGLIEEDIRVNLVGIKSMILPGIPGVSVGFDHLDRLCAWRSEPRPGFKVIEYFAGGSDAHEVYDVDEHIRRALRTRTGVHYQNALSLAAYGTDREIPASDAHHEPAIRARLKEAIETERKIEGVVADYDSEGRLIAYPLLDLSKKGND